MKVSMKTFKAWCVGRVFGWTMKKITKMDAWWVNIWLAKVLLDRLLAHNGKNCVILAVSDKGEQWDVIVVPKGTVTLPI